MFLPRHLVFLLVQIIPILMAPHKNIFSPLSNLYDLCQISRKNSTNLPLDHSLILARNSKHVITDHLIFIVCAKYFFLMMHLLAYTQKYLLTFYIVKSFLEIYLFVDLNLETRALCYFEKYNSLETLIIQSIYVSTYPLHYIDHYSQHITYSSLMYVL